MTDPAASLPPFRTLTPQNALDLVLHSGRGQVLHFATRNEMITFRNQIYSLRKKLQKESRVAFPPGHMHHGRSPYDAITITQDADAMTLTLSPHGILVRVTEVPMAEDPAT